MNAEQFKDGSKLEREALARSLDVAILLVAKRNPIKVAVSGPCTLNAKKRTGTGEWLQVQMIGGEILNIVGAAAKDKVVLLANPVVTSHSSKHEKELAHRYTVIDIPLADAREVITKFDARMGEVMDGLDAAAIKAAADQAELEQKHQRWREMKTAVDNDAFGTW